MGRWKDNTQIERRKGRKGRMGDGKERKEGG